MAEGHVPPQAVRNNAKRGLELREKHGRGGTAVGVARARDLSNGKALSLDTPDSRRPRVYTIDDGVLALCKPDDQNEDRI